MAEFDMCSIPRPYLKEDVLLLQVKEISNNMPVRRIKKYRGRPKKCGFSKQSKAQRLRRLKEKLAVTNSDVDVINMPRQKELAAQNTSDTKDIKHVLQEVINDPLHVFSKDTNTIQEISNPFKASSTTTSYCNSSEKTDISQPLCNSYGTQKPNLKTTKTTIHGRRIVDIDYFFNMLKSMNQHSKSGCSLNDIIITNEEKSGLSTSYCLKCTVCDFENTIWSECPTKQRNINTDTIDGMLSIDCNLRNMNKLLLKMDLPSLTRSVFTKNHHKDEVKRGIKITDPNSIKKCSNKLEESSELRLQTAACKGAALSKKSCKKNSTKLKKGVVLKLKPVTVSKSLDKSKICEQYYFNKLSVEDKFENENRSDTSSEDENILSQILDLRTSKTKDNFVIDQKQKSLNMTRTKNEINTDLRDGKMTEFQTNEMEITINYNKLLENYYP